MDYHRHRQVVLFDKSISVIEATKGQSVLLNIANLKGLKRESHGRDQKV